MLIAANSRFPPNVPNAAFEPDGCCGLIVLKNSKNPHSHFSAKIRCIGKAGPIRAEKAFGDAHTVKASIWPPPGQNFRPALYGEVFRRFSEKTEFFNTIGSVLPFAACSTKASSGPFLVAADSLADLFFGFLGYALVRKLDNYTP